ncbi:hypothetical protein [uncultured Paludibaculum sp.]|uniref:hypothetical protein n=1 Tax=uncultured Paludibaculum sp. TaxID=1765020 RepID=UPI002AAAFDC2|nr:hypothetical protein [uncultured Paludibaculum sp.]
MNPDVLIQLEKIAAAGIEIIPTPQVPTHFVFSRDGCVVLVERRGEGFGSIGSPGMLSEKGGFAALVDRAGKAWFIAKGEERPAQPGEAEAARRLFTDLKSALR